MTESHASLKAQGAEQHRSHLMSPYNIQWKFLCGTFPPSDIFSIIRFHHFDEDILFIKTLMNPINTNLPFLRLLQLIHATATWQNKVTIIISFRLVNSINVNIQVVITTWRLRLLWKLQYFWHNKTKVPKNQTNMNGSYRLKCVIQGN